MNNKRKILSAGVCFLPFVAFIGMFKVWPLIQVIIVSFKDNYNYLTKDYSSIGVENYIQVLSDEYFIQAVLNTLLYTVIVLVLVNIIAIPTAWCIYRVRRFSSLFRMAIFLPFVTSNIAIGMAWRIIFSDRGVLNFLLSALSIPNISWLADSSMSLITLVIYGVWSHLPFVVLLYYSFMTGIDNNLLLSATADGATDSRILFRIVLPVMMPTIIMTTMITAVNTWLEFDSLFPLFSGNPGPYYDLYTMVYYIYSKIHQGSGAFGIACASSVLLFACVFVFLMLRLLFKERKGSLSL